MEPKRFNIFLIDLSGAIGREENKVRPCIVVSNNIGNKHSDIITVIPMTSTRRTLPTHVLVKSDKTNGLLNDSMAQAEQLRTVDKCRIIEYLGSIPTGGETDEKIEQAIRVALFT